MALPQVSIVAVRVSRPFEATMLRKEASVLMIARDGFSGLCVMFDNLARVDEPKCDNSVKFKVVEFKQKRAGVSSRP
jgi:hypothetical protein